MCLLCWLEADGISSQACCIMCMNRLQLNVTKQKNTVCYVKGEVLGDGKVCFGFVFMFTEGDDPIAQKAAKQMEKLEKKMEAEVEHHK